MKTNTYNAFTVVTGALVVASTIALVISQPASATPKFAAETGKSCAVCHTNPKGGGELTALGEKFKANGNKMPP